MDQLKVIYYGMDKKLTEILEREKVKSLDQPEKLLFDRIVPDDKHIALCDVILKNDMDLLLVDLSTTTNIDQALRTLLYEIQQKHIKIIGLWNERENPNLKKWRFELGISTHFCYWLNDSGSMEDLMLGLARYLKISNADFTFYAKEQSKNILISTPMRINYFTTNGIQVESDIALRENEIVNCYFPSIPHYPFQDFYVGKVNRLNLNYPLEYQGTMEYVFYDSFGQLYRSSFDDLDDLGYLELITENPVISQNLDEKQVQAILDSFNHNKVESKNKKSILQRMVGKLSKFSDMDVLKNLVIDPHFATYKFIPKYVWAYPYNFLLVTTLEDNLNILNTCGAQLITFVISEKINPNYFMETTEFVQLKTICSRLKNNYQSLGISPPMLQIYNLDMKTPDLIEILEYDHLEVTKDEFEVNKHLTYIKKFTKTSAFTSYGEKIDTIIPKSYSPMSHGFLLRQVKLVSISESEIIFKTPLDLELDYSFIIKMDQGPDIYATIYKTENDDVDNIYYGIVNSLNESEKQNLRKLIIKG